MTDPQTVILETERLMLRPLTPDDADALFVFYRDPEMRRFFPEGVLTYAETQQEIADIIEYHYGPYGFGLWATIFKATGAVIGRCGLIPWKFDGVVEIEVAYMIDKQYWGQGLATEAARGLVAYAVEHHITSRLIALVDPENFASQKVAEHIGMTVERDDIIDGDRTFLYAMQV